MPRTPPRRFTLVDAMALVAATAVGIAMVRHSYSDPMGWYTPQRPNAGWSTRNVFWLVFMRIDPVAAYLAALWTIALAALRLRRPRPGFRRLSREPGTIACFAVVLTMPIQFILACAGWAFGIAVLCLEDGWRIALVREWGLVVQKWCSPYEARAPALGEWILHSTGLAVLASWLVLRLQGRRHSGASWIDRSGCVLGYFWIAHFALHWIAQPYLELFV